MVENGLKFEESEYGEKFIFENLSENSWKFGDVDVDVLIEFQFFEISKNCHIRMGNSGKKFEVVEEKWPEVNFTVRSPQENVFT